MNFSKNTQTILNVFAQNPNQAILSSTQIAEALNISKRTVLRYLEEAIELKLIQRIGDSRNIKYKLKPSGKLLNPVLELSDDRFDDGKEIKFNPQIFDWLNQNQIFNQEENKILENSQKILESRKGQIPIDVRSKEVERLITEFSWKSSKIEGNTYNLLDTEILLSQNIEAKGKTKTETQMVLNHKKAFEYIQKNPEIYTNLNLKNLQEIHSIIVGKLNIETGFRKFGVGIGGSLYKPLENQFLIEETISKFLQLINKTENKFKKAFFSWILIPYIQPFGDGNKRTGRFLANAILFSHNLPLLSFRNVSVKDYKTSTIIFYETNSIHFLKKIFLDQIQYFIKNYNI